MKLFLTLQLFAMHCMAMCPQECVDYVNPVKDDETVPWTCSDYAAFYPKALDCVPKCTEDEFSQDVADGVAFQIVTSCDTDESGLVKSFPCRRCIFVNTLRGDESEGLTGCEFVKARYNKVRTCFETAVPTCNINDASDSIYIQDKIGVFHEYFERKECVVDNLIDISSAVNSSAPTLEPTFSPTSSAHRLELMLFFHLVIVAFIYGF